MIAIVGTVGRHGHRIEVYNRNQPNKTYNGGCGIHAQAYMYQGV